MRLLDEAGSNTKEEVGSTIFKQAACLWQMSSSPYVCWVEKSFFFSFHVYRGIVTKHLFANWKLLTFRFSQCFVVLWLSLLVEIMYLIWLFLNCGRADWWIGQLYVSDSRTPCHWPICWCVGFATLSWFHKGHQCKHWTSVYRMSGRWSWRPLPPLKTC